MTGPTLNHAAETRQGHRAFADFCDGKTAIVHRVELEVSEDPTEPSLRLTLPDETRLHWPLHAIRSIPDQAGHDRLVITTKDASLARLTLRDSATPEILRARCPHLNHRPPVRGRARIVGWSLAALASVALIVFVLVPVMADWFGWQWAFAFLAIGPYLGVVAMGRLRAHPDAVKLAGGRR